MTETQDSTRPTAGDPGAPRAEGAARSAGEVPLPRGPAAQLLTEMPPILARGLVYLIVFLLVTALIWATYARVDVVVEAEGRLRPAIDVYEIQALQGGQVMSLMAQPGQYVTSGALLYVVHSLNQVAGQEKQKQEQDLLKRDIGHLTRGIDYLKESIQSQSFPTDPDWRTVPLDGLVSTVGEAKTAKEQLDVALVNHADAHERPFPEGIRTRETEEFKLKVEMKRAELAKAQATAQALRTEYETARSNLRIATDLHNTHRKLFSSGVVSKVEMLTQYQQLSAARSALANTLASIRKGDKDARQLMTDIDLLKDQAYRNLLEARKTHQRALTSATNRLGQWTSDLQTKEKRLAQISRDLQIASNELQRTEMRAPRAGTIDEVKINHVGAMVSAGQTVVTLVPDGTTLEAEVLFKNKDVGALRDGKDAMEARIKFDAFPYNEYGFLTGKLRLISADASVPGDKEGGYKGRVTLNTAGPGSKLESSEGRPAVLRSGMKVTVEIKKQERRVVDFLLKPFRSLRRDPRMSIPM
ncbi:MAG: HlyD family efflux transporter periplasmic adaptor subunit [Candidatus Riflebacteria bacterium]|nr:HlyD family efflux transporter periplasmic adaptor subunit [Candidatus Riflebacteria bacterium]